MKQPMRQITQKLSASQLLLVHRAVQAYANEPQNRHYGAEELGAIFTNLVAIKVTRRVPKALKQGAV